MTLEPQLAARLAFLYRVTNNMLGEIEQRGWV